MTLQIPDTIKILGIPYKIKEIPLIDHDVATEARINYWEQEIILSSALGPEKKSTLYFTK